MLTVLEHHYNQSNVELEVIIVDDGSDPEHNLRDIRKDYAFPIKLVEIDKSTKDYHNPCVPFNIGFREITGDVTIIQNPECYSIQNILEYVNHNLKQNDYLTCSCYSPSEEDTQRFKDILITDPEFEIKHSNLLSELPDNDADQTGGINAWYNHEIYRPSMYHFMSCLHTQDLADLNGFDMRYARGIAYDDNEFLERVRRKGMNVYICNDIITIHQYHQSFYDPNIGIPTNHELYQNYTRTETNHRVNIDTVYGK